MSDIFFLILFFSREKGETDEQDLDFKNKQKVRP